MLTNWLSPVSQEEISSYFSDVYHKTESFPDLKSAKVVVFSRHHDFCNLVRKQLGKLFNHFDVSIVDIGNLNTESASSIYQVISELQDGFILPVLIGCDTNSFIEFCKGLNVEKGISNATFVSNTGVNLQGDIEITNIGYQRHLIPKFSFQEILDSNTPGLSLGQLRSSQKILEPILRESNYFHFDLAALRKSESPNSNKSFPTGLHSEEACQIMRYVGEGIRLKLVSIDTSSLDTNAEVEAAITAEMIWYLHEGLSLRSEDHPAYSEDFKEFVIELNEVDHSLVFVQSNKSGKWWLKKEQTSNQFISCAFEEYQESISHEIPDRLLKLL